MKKLIEYLKTPKIFKLKLKGLLLGTYYIVFFKLFRNNVHIKFPFYAYAKVKIVGPGSVFIDRKCCAMLNVFKGLTIVTFTKKSKVIIGRNCLLGGVTIRCFGQVSIGSKLMSAITTIQDLEFIYFEKFKSKNDITHKNEIRPIKIGENVWLGAQSIILSGSEIGADCVVSSGSLCSDTKVKEFSLVSGNPSRRPLPIDKLIKLRA